MPSGPSGPRTGSKVLRNELVNETMWIYNFNYDILEFKHVNVFSNP